MLLTKKGNDWPQSLTGIVDFFALLHKLFKVVYLCWFFYVIDSTLFTFIKLKIFFDLVSLLINLFNDMLRVVTLLFWP